MKHLCLECGQEYEADHSCIEPNTDPIGQDDCKEAGSNHCTETAPARPTPRTPEWRLRPGAAWMLELEALMKEIDRLRAELAEERELRQITVDRNVAAHAETAAAERALADLRDQIISITESVQIPLPPQDRIYHKDYLTGATAYRHALREAIFAALRGWEGK